MEHSRAQRAGSGSKGRRTRSEGPADARRLHPLALVPHIHRAVGAFLPFLIRCPGALRRAGFRRAVGATWVSHISRAVGASLGSTYPPLLGFCAFCAFCGSFMTWWFFVGNSMGKQNPEPFPTLLRIHIQPRTVAGRIRRDGFGVRCPVARRWPWITMATSRPKASRSKAPSSRHPKTDPDFNRGPTRTFQLNIGPVGSLVDDR